MDSSKPNLKLFEDFLAGDSDARTELYGKYCPKLKKYCQKFVHSEDSAKDIVQETILRSLSNKRKFKNRTEEYFRTWLYVTARRLALDELKRIRESQKRFTDSSVIETFAASGESNPGDILLKEEKNQKVLDALKQLPASRREVIIEKYFFDFTAKDIGRAHTLTPGQVNRLLRDGRQFLKKKLKGTNDE